jgi:outer membrane lipoprotein-sorting protein
MFSNIYRSFCLAWIPAFAGMTIAVFLTWSPAFAETNDFLTPEQLAPYQKTITRVEKYLTGLTTIISDFTQVAPDGSLATGKFYLQRPGKMRWQYNPPTPVLMVADGKILTYYDYELQQVNYIKLDSTVIGFLAQKDIRFDQNVGIMDVEQKNGVIRIKLAQKEKVDEGTLTLEFSDHPIAIRNMVITDATQQVTTVSLNHATYGSALDAKLFDFTDPRKPKRY